MTTKKLFTIGILGASAVALGALGAHFLKSKIPSGLITPVSYTHLDVYKRQSLLQPTNV